MIDQVAIALSLLVCIAFVYVIGIRQSNPRDGADPQAGSAEKR
jgi:hypothetical protein